MYTLHLLFLKYVANFLTLHASSLESVQSFANSTVIVLKLQNVVRDETYVIEIWSTRHILIRRVIKGQVNNALKTFVLMGAGNFDSRYVSFLLLHFVLNFFL